LFIFVFIFPIRQRSICWDLYINKPMLISQSIDLQNKTKTIKNYRVFFIFYSSLYHANKNTS
jgi:hypothetical protein